MNTSAMIKSALLAALTAATSQVAIPQPLSSVPITLQVFFSLLAGAILGPTYGALSMLIYVLMGVIGLPVFSAGSSGLGTLLGPRGGYLIGFIAAAYVVGLIVTRSKRTVTYLTIAMCAGVITIYLFGVVQLSLTSDLSIPQAMIGGAAPFILFDFAKAIVVVAVARRIGFAAAKSEN